MMKENKGKKMKKKRKLNEGNNRKPHKTMVINENFPSNKIKLR